MKLSVNLTRWEIFNAYMQLYFRWKASAVSFFMSILNVLLMLILAAFLILELVTKYEFSVEYLSIFLIWLLLVLPFITWKKVSGADSILYLIRSYSLAKHLSQHGNKLTNFEFSCNDFGFIFDNKNVDELVQEEEREEIYYWCESPAIDEFSNHVSVVLAPFLFQLADEFKPPAMVILPRRAFENAGYNFSHFSEFCGNVINPNSEMSIQPKE